MLQLLPPKAVARFALIAIVVYAVLTWAYPSFQRAYAATFRSFGNAAFSQFWLWSEASVDFIDLQADDLTAQVNAKLPAALPRGFQLPRAEGVRDTLLVFKNRNTPANPGFLRTSSRIIGYTPSAVLFSLVLATPIAWKRRGWLLLWGMALVHLLILFRLTALMLHTGFANSEKAYALFRPGAFVSDAIARINTVFADNPTFAYVAPVFLWLMVLLGFEVWSTVRTKWNDAAAKNAAKRRHRR